jgi:hypothetical protein
MACSVKEIFICMVKQDGGEERRDVRTPVDLQVMKFFFLNKLRLALQNM